MASIIVAIISLIGSFVLVYLNSIKDIFLSKRNVYKERLEKFYIPFYQKYCAGALSTEKLSSLDIEARCIFLDLFTHNIHLMDAHSQALYSEFYLAFLDLIEAEDSEAYIDVPACCDRLDMVFDKMVKFTFNEYKRILKKCHLPIPLI